MSTEDGKGGGRPERVTPPPPPRWIFVQRSVLSELKQAGVCMLGSQQRGLALPPPTSDSFLAVSVTLSPPPPPLPTLPLYDFFLPFSFFER